MSKTYAIMFKPEMIRAYIKGVKTQTRRLKGLETVNETPDNWDFLGFDIYETWTKNKSRVYFRNRENEKLHYTCILPYGFTDSTLWFRETWRAWEEPVYGEDFILYRADNAKWQPFARDDRQWNKIVGRFDKWQSAMFMPHWASRFWNVRILSVRVERLQSITEEDAIAEGVDYIPLAPAALDHRIAYAGLWNKINGKKLPWSSNPWVFVYEFQKYDPEQVSKIHPKETSKQ